MISSIYDEILKEVLDSITPDCIAELDRIMTNIEWFSFPVRTDTVVMYKWEQRFLLRTGWLINLITARGVLI